MTKLRYIFEGRVGRVYPHSPLLSARRVGDEIVQQWGPKKWRLQIGDISLQLPDEPPHDIAGRLATVTIEIDSPEEPTT